MTVRSKLVAAAAVTAVCLTLGGVLAGEVLAQSAEKPGEAAMAAAGPDVMRFKSTVAVSVAMVVGLSCLGAGYAVARVGSAALGAASERPELLGRSLILVGLAEGIAIYGLIVGILLMYMK